MSDDILKNMNAELAALTLIVKALVATEAQKQPNPSEAIDQMMEAISLSLISLADKGQVSQDFSRSVDARAARFLEDVKLRFHSEMKNDP